MSFYESIGQKALFTDLYQLTMVAGYVVKERFETATFELFFRRLPEQRSYLVAAGLEQALDYLRNVRFTEEEIGYLRDHPYFTNVPESFFRYLKDFEFTGDVWAVPEGTIVFPNEPVVRVTAPLPEAQLVETYLLSEIVFQTMIASKASRVVEAARGRSVIDFGSRRAHGPFAAIAAARAAFIGGCQGTSNVYAAMRLGIQAVGTHAHSWVMSFPSEQEAFAAYHDVFPESTVLLIDTYDTVNGARNAAAFGEDVKGVRLDSGDLCGLSKEVRRYLDSQGLTQTKIVLSSDLNEYKIAELLENGAEVDLFGVGTEMVTSRDEPSLSGVYKITEYIGPDGKAVPCVKLSSSKQTFPGAKQIYRHHDSGTMTRDTLALAHEDPIEGAEPLLQCVMRDGRPTGKSPDVTAIQERAHRGRKALPAAFHELTEAADFPIDHTDTLRSATEEARNLVRKRQEASLIRDENR